jgi:hypothetical protein
MYPNEQSFPLEQDTKTLNSTLRELRVDVGKPQRSELVICQIILITWNVTPVLRDTHDLCERYGLNREDVIADKTLPEFVWFMHFALKLVDPKKHMDFIINHVVAPLSEKLSGKRYPAGGGSETIGTVMRHAIFERETGYMRPKSRKLYVLHGIRFAGLPGPAPPLSTLPVQQPLVASNSRKRKRITAITTATISTVPAESPQAVSGMDANSAAPDLPSGCLDEENFLPLIDFDSIFPH